MLLGKIPGLKGLVHCFPKFGLAERRNKFIMKLTTSCHFGHDIKTLGPNFSSIHFKNAMLVNG